ncbi:MAG: ribosomal-protein-alanine acetyltransferase [Lysobacterales bacterium]|jgi:ribosomal-protein-alanine N-acetyltransferase|nr:MAG: ribosomal-protein-alanine acetyltransferase [Xanthomonadales bacterium]
MRESDVPAVAEIERRAYAFPWRETTFRDCLRVGHRCFVIELDGMIVGYGLFSLVFEECHLLNLCIDPDYQGRGLGRLLLRRLCRIASGGGAERVYLEVRPSNEVALGLYRSEGFREIGRRPRYYPAAEGREDAIVMEKRLKPERPATG